MYLNQRLTESQDDKGALEPTHVMYLNEEVMEVVSVATA